MGTWGQVGEGWAALGVLPPQLLRPGSVSLRLKDFRVPKLRVPFSGASLWVLCCEERLEVWDLGVLHPGRGNPTSTLQGLNSRAHESFSLGSLLGLSGLALSPMLETADRCFRVLLGEIHALDVDAAPGEGPLKGSGLHVGR